MTKEMYEDLLERNRLQISELNTLTEDQDNHIVELLKENAELKTKLTLYEELEKTIEDYKATNHELAQDYANLSKRAIKWQEVGKILPENCTCVLCALKDGGLETAYYEDGDFSFCAPSYHVQDVAAWAYIPEYKGD